MTKQNIYICVNLIDIVPFTFHISFYMTFFKKIPEFMDELISKINYYI